MMIKRLQKDFEQGEILAIDQQEFALKVENWELQETSAQNLSKKALRVIKDNRLGSNYSFGSSDRAFEGLVEGSLESVEYGSKAWFDFSSQVLDTREEKDKKAFLEASPDEVFSFLSSFLDHMKERNVDINLTISLGKKHTEYSLLTTSGGDLKDGVANFHLFFGAPIPGGGTELYRGLHSPTFFTTIPEEEVESFLLDYSYCHQVSVPKSGRIPALFSPRSLYFLPISLVEGISGRNLFHKTSPLQDKLGEEILSKELTIEDQPQMLTSPHRRSFDDEGVPTKSQIVVEKGIVREYIYDQEFGARLKREPKGNGMKLGLFGGDIDTPVTPSLINPVIKPGTFSREEMVKEIEEGILVEGIAGFHSSNYPQGHFSVQAHGFHIKNGEIKGRLEDVMIAGNIYEDFKRVEMMGKELHHSFYGYAPYILVDGVSVTGR